MIKEQICTHLRLDPDFGSLDEVATTGFIWISWIPVFGLWSRIKDDKRANLHSFTTPPWATTAILLVSLYTRPLPLIFSCWWEDEDDPTFPCKRCRTKCPGSETAVKMVPSLCEKTLENYFREKISPWTRVGRGGFCLRRQICIDCGQPLVHRPYVAVATVFGTHTHRRCVAVATMHWRLWYTWGKVHYYALQPLVQRQYTALQALGTQALRSCSYNALKTLVHSG